MGDGPPRAAAHVFVDDLEDPSLGEDDRHHLGRVLRLRDGETVTASDGRGGVRPCRYLEGGRLEPSGDAAHEPGRSPAIEIGFALVKGERPELIVQKLTELGVDRILPFTARRSVVQWEAAKAARNLARLRQVARSAAMQSRQCWLPVVEPVRGFDEVVRGLAGAVRADFDGPPPTLETPVVLIGPEGGWEAQERASVTASVGLGPGILRAETAAIAVAVLLGALRSGTVRPADPRVPRSRGQVFSQKVGTSAPDVEYLSGKEGVAPDDGQRDADELRTQGR